MVGSEIQTVAGSLATVEVCTARHWLRWGLLYTAMASGSDQAQVSVFVVQITLVREGMMQEPLVHTLTHYESSFPPSHPTDNLAYLTQITVGGMVAKENRWLYSFLDRTVKYCALIPSYTSVLYRSHDQC